MRARSGAMPPRLRDVALVFQRPTLYPHLSVADNLAFGARMRHPNGPVRRLARHLFRPGRAAAAAHEERELGEISA